MRTAGGRPHPADLRTSRPAHGGTRPRVAGAAIGRRATRRNARGSRPSDPRRPGLRSALQCGQPIASGLMVSLQNGQTPPWSGFVGTISDRQCLHRSAVALTPPLLKAAKPLRGCTAAPVGRYTVRQRLASLGRFEAGTPMDEPDEGLAVPVAWFSLVARRQGTSHCTWTGTAALTSPAPCTWSLHNSVRYAPPTEKR